MDPASDQRAWSHARSFKELLELAEEFLDGKRSDFPGWGGSSMDEESDALMAGLRRALRVGFLTVASQPGAPFGPGHDGLTWGGRAFVGGFVQSTEAASELDARARTAGLMALCELPVEPAASWPPQVAGLRDGVPYLVLGPGARDDELDIFEDSIPPEAFEELSRAPFVWLVDPTWGRRDRLALFLERLSDVSCRSANAPHRRA